MDTKKMLKSFVTNFVNDNMEAATQDLSNVINAKTRELAGIVTEDEALQEKEYPKHSLFFSKAIYDLEGHEGLADFEKELKADGLKYTKSSEDLGTKEMYVFAFTDPEEQSSAKALADKMKLKYSFYGEKSGLSFSGK